MTVAGVATYDTQRDLLAFLADSYWGGAKYRSPSAPTIGTARVYRNVVTVPTEGPQAGREVITEELAATLRTYLSPHAGESERAFRQRIALAVYVNLCQPIVDAYADSVTGRVVRDLGPLADYLADVDGNGRDWGGHVEEVARWSAVYGMAATVVDAPRRVTAASRAEEAALGVGLRAILVPPTAWAWIDLDPRDGRPCEFAYVDQAYEADDVGAGRWRPVVLWRWTRERWERHETTVDPARGVGAQRARFAPETLADAGDLPPGLRGRMPVVFSYFRQDTASRWPQGVSLVGDAADIARQVYCLLSSAEESFRKTGFHFLAVPSKAQGGALEPDVQVKIGPDVALPFEADAGQPAWVRPPTETTAELRAHVTFLFALALRSAGLEVQADASAQAQSGEALRVRSRDFEGRAGKFARGMARFERQALDIAAAWLGMPAGSAAVSYPKRYVLPDAQEDLARAVLLLTTLAGRLGPEGVAAAMRQAIDAALSLSDTELARVMDEIRARFSPPGDAPADREEG